MDVLQAGIGEFSVTDPDDLRAFMRTEKRRAMVDKVMPEAEAVRRYVKDGERTIGGAIWPLRSFASFGRRSIPIERLSKKWPRINPLVKILHLKLV